MSHTILTGKHVAAFKRPNGRPVYALFERTHDSNVFPQEPRWRCQALGDYVGVVTAIHNAMLLCESQSLQSRCGPILPENLLKAWYKEMAKPTTLPNLVFGVGGAGDAVLSSVERKWAVDVLDEEGYHQYAEKLKEGGIKVSMHGDIDVVLLLFGQYGVIRPWKVLHYEDMLTLPAPGFPVPFALESLVPPAVAQPTHQVLKVDDHFVLVKAPEQEWACWDWQYNAVQRFIEQSGLQMELARQCSSIKAIGQFRAACDSAATVPPITEIEIYRPTTGSAEWVVKKFRDITGTDDPCDEPPAVFYTSLRNAQRGDYIRQICEMPHSLVIWRIPIAADAVVVEPDPGMPAHQQQLALVD